MTAHRVSAECRRGVSHGTRTRSPVKALQVRRTVGGSGWPGWRRRWRRRRRCGSGRSSYTTVDPPELPGPGWHRVHTRLAGICGVRPVDDRGPRLDVLRRLGQLPVRARPRGRRRARRRHARRARAGARPRGPRLRARRSTAPRPATATTTPTSPPGHLEPGIQTGFCCSTGGGWAPRVRRPRDPAAPRRRRRARRAGRARRAARRRHPRRAHGRRARRRRPPASRSSPCSAPARWASPRSPGSCATCPTARVVVGARYPHQQRARPRSSAPTTSCRPTELARAVRRIVGCHVVGDHLVVRRPRHDRRRRQRALDRRRRCAITRPRGRVVMMGMPAEVTARPDRAVAPRDRARRRLHLRHRDAADGAACARSTSPSRPPTPSRPSAGSRPPTPSTTTSTPSPTPPPPAGAAPSRSPSTCDGAAT